MSHSVACGQNSLPTHDFERVCRVEPDLFCFPCLGKGESTRTVAYLLRKQPHTGTDGHVLLLSSLALCTQFCFVAGTRLGVSPWPQSRKKQALQRQDDRHGIVGGEDE